MSKVRMKRIFICGPKSKRKYVLELLQRAGLVEINSGDIQDDDLQKMDVNAERAGFMRAAKQAEQALAILDEYAPDKSKGMLSSLEGASDMKKASYDEQTGHAKEYYATANKIIGINKQILEDKAAIPKCETNLETLSAWTNLDLPLNFSGTAKSRAFIGSVGEEDTLEQLYSRLYETFEGEAPDIDIDLISSSKTMTAFMVVCHVDDADRVESSLKKIDFIKAPSSKLVPTEEIASIKKKISELEADIKKCGEEISTYAPERDNIKFAADYYTMRADKYEVLSQIPQSVSAFFISGYTPAKTVNALAKKLEELDSLVEITDPQPDEEVPCELKNGFLADPMETVVDAYSYPNISEIDPSAVIACFYYIMFGMMLSDAGYGILLALGCGFVLLKVRNLQPGMKKMMKLMFFSGISTTFWGFMFGSFFGDAVNVIATTFFNRPDISLDPIWFNPQAEPMRLLVVAFAIGIVHLFTGLFIKLYELIRNGQVKDAIYDVVFWFMFIGGAIVYLLSMDMITGMLSLNIKLSAAVTAAAKWITIIGAVGVILTGGREHKNWGVRIASGLYSAYGCTSWLSDILSYSRLLALGLATGVIAQVFNKMGSMVCSALPLPIGIILFIAIFVVGHLLNLSINVLGAYVHTNRLQFVEFFGKFYDGGGKKFEPFTENTKYYSVKEDI